MKKLFALLVILFFIVTYKTVHSQSAAEFCSSAKIKAYESLFKSNKTNYPGDQSIDALYYKIDLTIVEDFIKGKATVKVKPSSASIDTCYLDLKSNMVVDSVYLNGAKISFTRKSGEDKLGIKLPVIYSPLDIFTIVVFYQGYPIREGFGGYVYSTDQQTTRRSDGQPVIWTLTEPYSAKNWFPCKDSPADKVDSSDVWITADDFYTTVSNGTLEEVLNNGETKTYKWKNRYPIAHYLISIAMTNYEVYNDEFEYGPGKIMPVTHYVYPGTLTAGRIAELERTVPMLEFFSEVYGLYPFINDKYGHAQCGFSGGMEHQTISSMGGFGETLVAHELAHQWFGDKITCVDWHNIWLNEGFATYSEALWLEHHYGKERYKEQLQYEMFGAGIYSASNAQGSIYVTDISSIGQIFSSSRSYAKGATVLHMLRGVLGDEKFFEAIKAYATDSTLSYGAATTEDFQNIVQEVSGLNLEYFFDEWIYGENYPRYNYTWGYTEQNNSYKVTINISQQNNTNPTFFTMPIQLQINTAQSDTLIKVFNDQKNQSFEFFVDSKPSSLIFDPENWIFKTASGTTEVGKKYELLNTFSLEQNYPNPFNPSTKFNYYMYQRQNVKITIYDLVGNEIAVLVDEEKNPGVYEVEFNPALINKNLASGVYIYQMKTDTFTDSKKMVLLK